MKIRLEGEALKRARRGAHDIELINRNADELNAEALDDLEDQAPVDFDEDAPSNKIKAE